MPLCIECRYPVPQLYHVLHSGAHKPSYATSKPSPSTNSTSKSPTPSGFASPKATSPSAATGEIPKPGGGVVGGDVRLTQCPRCKRFADKYVEHDFVVLFIDLVLVKPQVYRHLLFNRLGRDDDQFDPSIIRLGTLLLLFDVYITWSAIESLSPPLTSPSPIPHLPILLQYAFYLLLCTLTTLAQHLTIRLLAGTVVFRAALSSTSPTPGGDAPPDDDDDDDDDDAGYNSRPNTISTAILVSSCMKLFPILIVVWRYDDVGGQVGYGVQWAVALQNLEALRILLGCSYWGAGVLVGAGALARWAVGRVVLGAFGLGDVGGAVVASAAFASAA
ncbi:sterol homeostasis protein [Xylographa carneopallida]|nr:sterol homeostasis protein [Xylographa carneopallida]